MKTIRKSDFETNSSSTHSISIDDSGANYTSITPDRDGNIVLKGGQFGWEIGDFNDPLTKANYCAVDQLSDEDNIKMLKNVLMEQTGAKRIVFDFSEDYKHTNWSYIDHQSVGTSNNAFKSEETLRDFIFSKDSVLHTDNDNH